MKRPLRGATFKSKSENGDICKTYVTIYENGSIGVCQRYLSKTIQPNCIVIKRFKDWVLCDVMIGFKFNSFITILDIIDTYKEEIYKSIENERNA